MQSNKNTIKLIIVILIIAFISGVYLYVTSSPKDKVVITVDGQLYGSYDLNKDQTIDIKNNDDLNFVKIIDGQVDVVYSNCYNQICVNEYPISKDNPFVIVCLPHKVIIAIEEK